MIYMKSSEYATIPTVKYTTERRVRLEDILNFIDGLTITQVDKEFKQHVCVDSDRVVLKEKAWLGKPCAGNLIENAL